jgi:glycine cleavage system aminomethyltransferase T
MQTHAHAHAHAQRSKNAARVSTETARDGVSCEREERAVLCGPLKKTDFTYLLRHRFRVTVGASTSVAWSSILARFIAFSVISSPSSSVGLLVADTSSTDSEASSWPSVMGDLTRCDNSDCNRSF